MYSESLVDLCLETIVDNFPRYNSVFNTTKDDSMKRRFEFLQRKYSFEILSRLSTKGGSLEEYVDLLINKYLKVLDTSWLRNCSWEKVTSKIAEIGCNVEKITFNPVHFTNGEEISWEEIICYFPNLKSFIFYNRCTDIILEHVAIFCPDIEEIDVKSSPVFSNGVKYLCENRDGESACTKLKKLHVFNTEIKADDVKYLIQNFPLLEIMDYDDLPLVLYSLYKDLSSLDNVKPYKIVKLDLSFFVDDPCFVDIRRVCLTVCPHLKSLTYALSANDNLDVFPKLSELEKLCMNTSLSKINIDKILKAVGRKLTHLKVVRAKVSLTVLAESCPSITILDLNGVDLLVDNDSEPIFASLSSLKCNLYFSNISKNARAILLLLSSSEKLESLSFEACDLMYSQVSGYILRCCERNPIKELSFCDSVVEKDFIKELLLNSHTLSCLKIKGCLKKKQENELLELVKFLPNKPKICISNRPAYTDSEDDSEEDSDDYVDPYEDDYDCEPYDGCGFY